MEKIYLTEENLPKVLLALRGENDGILFRAEESCVIFKVIEHNIHVYDVDSDDVEKSIIDSVNDILSLKEFYNDQMEEVIRLLVMLLNSMSTEESHGVLIFNIPFVRFIHILSNNQRTLSSNIVIAKLHPEYRQLEMDGVKIMTILHGASDENKYEMISNISSEGLGAVLIKRINAFQLEDAVSNDGKLFWMVLDVNTPGALMLYLIKLLDFYTEHNRPATLEDLGMRIFPNGFYTTNSGIDIVNNIVKENKAINGYIY